MRPMLVRGPGRPDIGESDSDTEFEADQFELPFLACDLLEPHSLVYVRAARFEGDKNKVRPLQITFE